MAVATRVWPLCGGGTNVRKIAVCSSSGKILSEITKEIACLSHPPVEICKHPGSRDEPLVFSVGHLSG